jgi:hypothetical protein
MKTSLIIISLILSGLSAETVFAQGSQTHGGGDIVICRKDGKETRRLLELHLLARKNKFPNLGGPELSLRAKIDIAYQYHADIDPVRALEMKTEVLQILEEIEAQSEGKPSPYGLVEYTPTPLREVDDANENYNFPTEFTSPEVECIKRQLALQIEDPLFPKNPVYTINEKNWLLLESDDQRTGLLYHEVWLRRLRQKGAINSLSAQYLTQMQVTGEIKNISSGDYFEFLLRRGINDYFFMGHFNLSTFDFRKDARNEVDLIRNRFETKIAGISVILSDMYFENRRMTSALMHSTFGIDEAQNQITQGNLYSAGKVVFNPDQTVEIMDGEHASGEFKTRFIIDQKGNILSRFDTHRVGTVAAPLRPESKKYIEEILKRMRKWTRKDDYYDYGMELIAKVRKNLATQDTGVFRELVDLARKPKKIAAEQPKPVYDESVNWVMYFLKRPHAIECKGFNISAEASLIVGGHAGIIGSKCLLSNGEINVYVGPRIGLLMPALGAGIQIGKVDISKAYTTLAGKRGLIVYNANFETLMFFQGPKRNRTPILHLKKQTEESSEPPTPIEEHRVELGVSWALTNAQVIPLVRVARKGNDFTHIMKQLTKGILSEL